MIDWRQVRLVAAYAIVLAAELSNMQLISPPLPVYQASDWDRLEDTYDLNPVDEVLVYTTGSAPVGYTGTFFNLRIPL